MTALGRMHMSTLVRAAITFIMMVWMLAAHVYAAETVVLPRKAVDRNESYPGVTVLYDAISDAGGRRLRVIATHPVAGGDGRFPTIFIVGWLS